jgi:transcriptional regulator with XRE-family HTH domain
MVRPGHEGPAGLGTLPPVPDRPPTAGVLDAAGVRIELPVEDEDARAYQRRLGAQLRAVRRARGLRLQDVEARSGGRFKAVVVGSYERGDRAVAAHRLAALARFYDVPLEDLLPDGDRHHGVRERGDEVALDLDALRMSVDPTLEPLKRLVHHVQWQRGDYNGRVLTLRADDLRTVAVAAGAAPDAFVAALASAGLLARP